jgi:hypothetical protein
VDSSREAVLPQSDQIIIKEEAHLPEADQAIVEEVHDASAVRFTKSKSASRKHLLFKAVMLLVIVIVGIGAAVAMLFMMSA